ncbi:RNA-splicing factor [Coemansia aciculifera]|uniref:RNA-splicing factor n=1 Tax=Coemansia aciculifera TaxID=417176 RepID=A0ACC1M7S4_9FUNG|nr:RNA-splicing factor [Coemansia aciculifera]
MSDGEPDKEQAQSLFKKSKRRGANLRKRPIDGIDGLDDNLDSSETLTAEVATPVAKTSASTRAREPKQQKTSGDASPGEPDTANQDTQPPTSQSEAHRYRPAVDSARTVGPDVSSSAAQDPLSAGDESGETLYKGKKAYSSRIQVRDGARKIGPFKAPTNVRVTSVFDYQPNLCKDYKETGYCGYGDSCIFLHDRSTAKTGWQLEKEFEEAQHGAQRDNSKLWQLESDDDDKGGAGKAGRRKGAAAEELPFACLICRKTFTKPVVTKCQHYFCEACALAQYRKTPKCFACGAATAGIFKQAKNLQLPAPSV